MLLGEFLHSLGGKGGRKKFQIAKSNNITCNQRVCNQEKNKIPFNDTRQRDEKLSCN